MAPLSSSSSTADRLGGGAPSAFLMAALSFFLLEVFFLPDAFWRDGSTTSRSPGVVKEWPHLGHLTFLPSGTGLAGRNTDLQSGQVIREDAMFVRPE